MVVDICLIIGGVVFACKAVRVVPVRKQAYFYVHAFFQQHVNPSDAGFDAGSVTVIEYRDVIGEPVNQADLLGSQCGSR